MKKRSPYATDAGAIAPSSGRTGGPLRSKKKLKQVDAREAEWFASVQKQWGRPRTENGEQTFGADVDEPSLEKSSLKTASGGQRHVEVVQSRQDRKWTQQHQLSAADLEQKKMLLPYLDDIEYINVQLRMRGLLPDEEPANESVHGAHNMKTPIVAWNDVAESREASNLSTHQPSANAKSKGKHSEALSLPSIHGALQTNQDDAPQNKIEDTESTSVTTRLNSHVLRARYPRFVESLQLCPTAKTSPRVRLVVWLLRLIEDIYSSLSECFTPSKSAVSTSAPGKAAKLVMPHLVRRFIHHALGLRELADKECVDLVFNVELRREQFPEVATFSQFLRELFDEDHLLFYLHVRHVLQAELDLNLASKEKRAHTSTLGRKYTKDALIETRNHPLVPDGTQQVLLSPPACEMVIETVFATAACMNSRGAGRPRATPQALAQFLVRVKLTSLFTRRNSQGLAVLEDFMATLVQMFQEVDEDITAIFKYNDDGESLTSLLRMRDTISSEAKIQAWMASYSVQEKLLRNMRIDQVRMERSNGDNKFRVELRLLQHRIHLQEQELEHIKHQISTAQAAVDNVWNDVVKQGRSHSEPQHTGSQLYGRIDKELASVLGRFEAYIAKLHQKYSITVKAASVLATPWQRQVEEYRVQMIIRIQRAYRSRRHAREIKLDAREKLKQQIQERELKIRNEQLEKQRLQALQAKDLERHQMRMRAKQEQEAKLKAEQDARQKAIIDRVREHEVEQMRIERSRRAVSRMWSNWRQFLGRRRQTRKAHVMFLKLTLLKWKRHFAAFKKADYAARTLQRFARSRQERAKFRKEMRHQAKRNALARKYLQKVQRRVVVRLFNHWIAHVEQQQTLRANFAEVVQKRERHWLTRWSDFVANQGAAKDAAARLVQRVYHGRLARRLFQYSRHRHNQALAIQRVFRGYRSRLVTSKIRKLRAHQEEGATSIRTRVYHRALGMCFWGLRRHTHIEVSIKAMDRRRQHVAKRDSLFAFALNATNEKEARAALERLKHKSATRIQRQFRRHLCQRVFREQIRLYRAARSIQRVYRGYRDRQAVKQLRWQVHSAMQIQTAWRRFRARKFVTSLRVERILAAAFRGDYAVIKRAIAGGYWFAADAEGNGILHTAAAAGHKRIVKLCLRCSFDVDAVNAQHETPLHLVLANLSPPRHLLPGAGELDANDPEVRARADRLALAEYMIDHGAWQEAPDMHGLTPLLLSSSLGHADAVEMLLDRGANTEARTFVGQLNAVQLAVEGNHYEALRVLLASRAFDPAPTVYPEQPGTDYDADVYADPPPTWLQLHACAGRGLYDCLRVLLDHILSRPAHFLPGTLDRRDREGYTPLIYAVSSKSTDAVKLLLERGAGPDGKDYFGRAPLHFALQSSSDDQGGSGDGLTESGTGTRAREEIVRLLTVFDADVNVKDTDGDVPLHLSCQSDALLGCSSLLLTSGAALVANAIGNHPTHVAAQRGAIATLRLLMEYGGDMNLKNYASKTPLGVARMHGQLAVVEFVRDYFARETIEALDGEEGEGDSSGKFGAGNEEDDRMTGDKAHVDEARAEDEEPGEKGIEDTLQERTPEQWASALATAFRMDTLAEWTMFIDGATGVPFYANSSASDGRVVCSWEPSVEFDAALASDWEVVRCPPGWTPPIAPVVDHHEHDHRRGALVADAPAPSMARSATEWRYLYHHRVTGELRTQVPPMDLELLQDVVQRSTRHQQLLRARVRRAQAGRDDVSASAVEYLRFSRAFAAESAQARAEHLAAAAIQRRFRARRTLRLVRRLLLQSRRAVAVQRAFRAQRARRHASALDHRRRSAAAIQAAWRGFSTRRREQVGGPVHAERARCRRRLGAARTIQRVFRGLVGRRTALLEALRGRVALRRFARSSAWASVLPPTSAADWQQLCARSSTRRSLLAWDELRAPRELLLGLPFYRHHATRACSWEPSAAWRARDREAFEARRQRWAWGYSAATERAARALQRLWRARAARVALRAVLSAMRLMRRCERAYLEDPTSLVALGNYALFLLAVAHDGERARPLLARLRRAMEQRGPDVPFVLLACALSAYVAQEADAQEASELVARARALDPALASFRVALLGFFRPQALVHPGSCAANVNYAACLQWLVAAGASDATELAQLDGAQEHYMRALAADPRRRGTLQLLQDVLDRRRAILRRQRPRRRRKRRRQGQGQCQDTGPADEEDAEDEGELDAHEAFRRWQAQQAAREDEERARALAAQRDRDAREAAAVRIQARYRRRRAQRQTRRLRLELRRAAAHAEQATARAVHAAVSRAFDLVEAAASAGKRKAKAKAKDTTAQTLSLPVERLEAVFAALVGGSEAGATEGGERSPAALAAAFARTHRGARHANVLDVCRFVHATPALEAAVDVGDG